jgi:hypothetical protein
METLSNAQASPSDRGSLVRSEQISKLLRALACITVNSSHADAAQTGHSDRQLQCLDLLDACFFCLDF